VNGQQFASAMEVTAKEMTALTEVSQMIARNASKSFKNAGKSDSMPEGTTFMEMLCKEI
jgi:hypothetical protein